MKRGPAISTNASWNIDPNNYAALRRLCVLYDNRGTRDDFKKAEELYRKVAKLRPNDPDLWNDWGYSLYLRTEKEYYKENWAEAERKLRQALKLDPHHAAAHGNLGLVLGQLNRFDEALREFRAAQTSEAGALRPGLRLLDQGTPGRRTPGVQDRAGTGPIEHQGARVAGRAGAAVPPAWRGRPQCPIPRRPYPAGQPPDRHAMGGGSARRPAEPSQWAADRPPHRRRILSRHQRQTNQLPGNPRAATSCPRLDSRQRRPETDRHHPRSSAGHERRPGNGGLQRVVVVKACVGSA